MMKPEKIVNVVSFRKNQETEDLLGWCWKPVMTYDKEAGWLDTGKQEKLFGMLDPFGNMTHMSYTLNIHHHETWQQWYDELATRQFADGTVGLDKFYFDAGGNGYPIYVEMPELKRAMIELGLYNDNSSDSDSAESTVPSSGD